MTNNLWLSTKAAADSLGISRDTLKRRRDCSGGYLEGGKHWCYGPEKNSPYTWNVDLCRQEFHRRGVDSHKQKSASGGNCESR